LSTKYLKLPSIFSDGMVIEPLAKIWGNTKKHTNVSIKLLDKKNNSILSDRSPDEVMSNEHGDFEIHLEIWPAKEGGPYTLNIKSEDEEINIDTYVGLVFLCAGQSNMEQPLSRTKPLLDKFINEDIRIHAFHIEKKYGFHKEPYAKGEWTKAMGDDLLNMFAVPYFFAKKYLELNLLKDTPIGLINIAAGGTPVEAWLPKEIIKNYPDLYEKFLPYEDNNLVAKIEEENQKRVTKWHEELEKNDKGILNDWHEITYFKVSDELDDDEFDDDEFDDDEFEEYTTKTTTLLDNSKIIKFGSVWYKKFITIAHPNIRNVKECYIDFGRVTDSIKIWINDVYIGQISYQYPPARLKIPNGILTNGQATILIRVVGESNPIKFAYGHKHFIELDGKKIEISGKWEYEKGHEMEMLEPSTWFYNMPTCVYNTMLYPILGYSISAMLWYQGESNTNSPNIYPELFKDLINHIREESYNQYKYYTDEIEQLPVYYTQLANYVDPHGNGENWAKFREMQRNLVEIIPNSKMAVIIDSGEYNDLHPKNKKTVGERLALLVQSDKRYSDKYNELETGPQVQSAIYNENNRTITISFKYAMGLWINGRPFVILSNKNDSKKIFEFAKIENNCLLVENIDKYDTVEFGYFDSPYITLYNGYNMPASPFKIDIQNL